ncbi:hypothetical protein [Mesomycoplasma ovipneumoniae]|uniref:Uncharacterized protein n=1 Tax=Mesomycoplasma ovipneumoniae TaxID=29562 RepID=A0AAJ2UDF2_9BACT|nr:hypothetical protein [Mesomycoplasma ovipneumoniae]MDW2893529.1 hypothetical protein [Mesomycoplasma ovipneumoniae]
MAKNSFSGYFFEVNIPQEPVAKNFHFRKLTAPAFTPAVVQVITFSAKNSL